MRISFIDVDGVNTRYYHEGDGPALLLVHGYGSCADMWSKTIDLLARDFAVYAPDLLGHGFTDFEDFGDVPPQVHLARHLARFLDCLGIERAGVVGNSLGGVIAPLLYFERPQQVEKLVLMGIATPFSETGAMDPEVLRAANANGSKAMKEATFAACRARLGNIVHDPAVVPGDIVMAQLTSYAIPDRLTSYQRLADGMLATIDSDAARVIPENIKVPTLVLTGRQDIRADIDVVEAGYRRIPDVQLVIVEECGHLAHVEHPEFVSKTIADFVR